MATHSSILAWKTHGWRSLAGYSPWGHKELDSTECTLVKKQVNIKTETDSENKQVVSREGGGRKWAK